MNDLQITDSMTVLAIIALGGGLLVIFSSIRSAIREPYGWRRAAYIVGGGLGLYTAVCYYIVLFIDPAASVAWLRPAIIFWMGHWLVVRRIIATVAATSEGEQARLEIQRLKHHIANLEQSTNILEGVTVHYQEALAELDEKYTGSNELVINLRNALANMVDEQIKTKQQLVQAERDGERGKK